MPEDIYRKKAAQRDGSMGELQSTTGAIAAEMEDVVRSTEVLNRQMNLLMSIDGEGRIVALNMTTETEAFTRFDDSRKFCCHAGVAPFAHTSGSTDTKFCSVDVRLNQYVAIAYVN